MLSITLIMHSCLWDKFPVNPFSFFVLMDITVIVIPVIFYLYLPVCNQACEKCKGIQVNIDGQMPPALVRA